MLWLQDDQPLRPSDIVGKKCTFARVGPLVFLNACETGQMGLSLTGSGGWARAFVKAGVGSFVGSLWEAQDESAYHFAEMFYQQLLEGKTVANATRIARRAIRKAGDPTWLSYTVYANPLARIEQREP
jgi:CHAT domain-containing protein